jgi:hypothetical protein
MDLEVTGTCYPEAQLPSGTLSSQRGRSFSHEIIHLFPLCFQSVSIFRAFSIPKISPVIPESVYEVLVR